MIPSWFQTAIDHPNKARGIDILFDKIGGWYDVRDYESVDKFLSELEEGDIASVSDTLMVGILSITLPAAHLLPARDAIYNRIRTELEIRLPDRVDRILDGLREPSPKATEAHNQIFSGLLGGPAIPTEEP